MGQLDGKRVFAAGQVALEDKTGWAATRLTADLALDAQPSVSAWLGVYKTKVQHQESDKDATALDKGQTT